MFIESASQLYLGREMTCAHIVADKTCTWRFWNVLDKDDDYAFQWVAKANGAKTVTIQIGDQETTFALTGSFQQFKHVFEGVRIANHPYLDVTFPEGDFFIGRTQLEHGSIVTDWQRSQDDDKNSITSLWSALEITAEEIRGEVHAAYHVTNLVPTVYSRQQSSGDEWTPSSGALGLKWVTNSDGSVTAEALTSGVATTGQSAYAISGYSLTSGVPPITLDPTKAYTITGCPAGGSASTYFVRVRVFAENETPSSSATFEDDSNQFYDYGDGLTLQAGWAYLTIHLVITSGYTIPDGGITFWPMVVEGSEQYPYVPAGSGDTSMWSVIKQNAGKISLVVDSDNNINAGEIALAINSAGSEATISANRIGLSGDVIDLTGKNITIASTNFNVSANGTITATNANITGAITSPNATITGGTILIEPENASTSIIRLKTETSNRAIGTEMSSAWLSAYNTNSSTFSDIAGEETQFTFSADQIFSSIDGGSPVVVRSYGRVDLGSPSYSGYLRLDPNTTDYYNNGGTIILSASNGRIDAPNYYSDGYALGKSAYYGQDNISVLHNTWTTLGSYIFPAKGTYLVTYTVYYPANANGYRYSMITSNANDTEADTYDTRDVRTAMGDGLATYTKLVHLYTFSEATTKYFRVKQNSNSTLSCSLRVYVMKTA